MDKNRVLLVLDGVAESTCADRATTLERARPPYLSRLARSLGVGLFEPRHPRTGAVSTEMVLAGMLGVSVDPWPGKAWFEAIAFAPGERYGYAAILRSYGSDGGRLQPSPAAMRELNSLRMPGGQFAQRTYELTASSWLLAAREDVPARQIEDTLSAANKIMAAHYAGKARIEPSNVFHAPSPPLVRARLSSCALAHAQGALLGLCGIAGIVGLQRPCSPMDQEGHIRLFADIRRLVDDGRYRNLVIYVKALDWASHLAQGRLKALWLDLVDRELVSFLLSRSAHLHITIISDHRTDIGSPSAVQSTSIFATAGLPAADCPFEESAVETLWQRSPLSLSDLSCLAFPACG